VRIVIIGEVRICHVFRCLMRETGRRMKGAFKETASVMTALSTPCILQMCFPDDFRDIRIRCIRLFLTFSSKEVLIFFSVPFGCRLNFLGTRYLYTRKSGALGPGNMLTKKCSGIKKLSILEICP
jgi:hypothetical protein